MSAISPAATPAADHAAQPRWAWLPAPGTWKYHALLLSLGVLVLGPLGGITASFMNFSIGFFVGGQVLAGILGSTVTYGYGVEGKHGANYLQTSAASVAGMCAMGVLIQAMVWMGLPQPPMWQLMLYMMSIGMFGVGLGMLVTPILVDRMQLTFPSGLAVANILRALTDVRLLRASVARLGGGIATGILGGIAAAKVPFVAAVELSTSTLGAGMVIGPRLAIATFTGGFLGYLLRPWFVSIGWLQPHDPFRKITFLIALGMIMGAAIVDLSLLAVQAVARWRQVRGSPREKPADGGLRLPRLIAWVAFWGAMVVTTGHVVLGQPVYFLVVALVLCFVFALVNGISLGISDSNPISSAFVVSVLVMAGLGLHDPVVGLMAGTVILVAISVASDMQQDRSTGWRLGTNRVMQFRYQTVGIVLGAILAVGLAQLYMAAYPVLKLDQTVMKAGEQPAEWTSAMTYKLVGVLRSLQGAGSGHQREAIWWGVGLGLAIEVVRKLLARSDGWQRFIRGSRGGRGIDFVLDSTLLASPYAVSFGGFFGLNTSAWMAAGGIITGLSQALGARDKSGRESDLPADMSSTSLVGGGLIAGDALAALGLGIVALLGTVA